MTNEVVSQGTSGDGRAQNVDALVAATLFIAVSSFELFNDELSYLIGRSPGEAFLKQGEELARSVDGVLDVHDLRAEYIKSGLGPCQLAHCGEAGYDHRRGRPNTEEVHERVQQGTGCRNCVVHVDPQKKQDVIMSFKNETRIDIMKKRVKGVCSNDSNDDFLNVGSIYDPGFL